MLTMPRGQCWQSDPLRSRIPRSAACGPCTWPADRRSRRAPRPANQMKAILVMAPEAVRARFRGLDSDELVATVLRCRGFYADTIVADTIVALKALAERHRDLGRQISMLTAHIDPIVTAANPALRAAIGVGPQVAAQLLITAGLNPDRLTSEASFAALCGVAPVPASSGKTRHYRLSRGGDRQANHAVHRIALNRMSHHQPTIAYVHPANRPVQQRDPAAAETRDLSRDLPATHPALPSAAMEDLRPAREAK